MLVLYETPLGFCLFKVSDAGKLDSPDLWKEFETPERANSLSVFLPNYVCLLRPNDVLCGARFLVLCAGHDSEHFSRLLYRLKLRALHRFTSTASAVEDITALQEGKISKSLKKFLTTEVIEKGKGKETLAVVDSKLGALVARTFCLLVLTLHRLMQAIPYPKSSA